MRILKTRGIKPSQLIILLVDEPYSHERDEVIIGWARPLKKALPELVLFEDPIYANPEEAIMDMYEVSDILCPNTIRTVNFGHKPFFLNYKAKGKTLWLYSCSGPARSLDPVAYHRGQMWHCFEMGAKGAFYWALGCGGGIGDSWHAFNQSGVEYSPYFVSQTDTMDAKQSEGVREVECAHLLAVRPLAQWHRNSFVLEIYTYPVRIQKSVSLKVGDGILLPSSPAVRNSDSC